MLAAAVSMFAIVQPKSKHALRPAGTLMQRAVERDQKGARTEARVPAPSGSGALCGRSGSAKGIGIARSGVGAGTCAVAAATGKRPGNFLAFFTPERARGSCPLPLWSRAVLPSRQL